MPGAARDAPAAALFSSFGARDQVDVALISSELHDLLNVTNQIFVIFRLHCAQKHLLERRAPDPLHVNGLLEIFLQPARELLVQIRRDVDPLYCSAALTTTYIRECLSHSGLHRLIHIASIRNQHRHARTCAGVAVQLGPASCLRHLTSQTRSSNGRAAEVHALYPR